MVENMKKFIDYGVQDVTCLIELVKVSSMIDIWLELAIMLKVSLHDVFSYEFGGLLVDFICHKILEKGTILPYKYAREEFTYEIDKNGKRVVVKQKKPKTQGAFNHTVGGLFRHVVESDISSAYPSAMIMLLLSPELFHSMTNDKLDEHGILSIKLDDNLLAQKLADGSLSNGTSVWINLKIGESGLLDLQIDGFKKKSEYKKSGETAKEKVYKLLLNTIYGLLNQFKGRLCIKELGALVT